MTVSLAVKKAMLYLDAEYLLGPTEVLLGAAGAHRR